jgi:hypothetical protein
LKFSDHKNAPLHLGERRADMNAASGAFAKGREKCEVFLEPRQQT